jgi:hypothetical protein
MVSCMTPYAMQEKFVELLPFQKRNGVTYLLSTQDLVLNLVSIYKHNMQKHTITSIFLLVILSHLSSFIHI